MEQKEYQTEIENLSKEELEEKIKELETKINESKNGTIKQQSKVYRLLSKAGRIVEKVFLWTSVSALALLLVTTIHSYCARETLTANQQNILSFYDEYDVHSSYDSRQNDDYLHRLTIQRGKPVKFNICAEMTEAEIEQLQTSIDELNAIFAVINPEYKFELNLNPNKLEIADPYNVDVSFMSEKEKELRPNSLALYMTPRTLTTENGLHSLSSQIKFRDGYVNSQNFSHEILHHLGLGDAYLQTEAIGIDSIMHAGETHIRKNDVALLIAKYGDYSTPEKADVLIDYLNNYEQSQAWYNEEFKEAYDLIEDMKEYLQQTFKAPIDQFQFDFAQDSPVYALYSREGLFYKRYDSIQVGINGWKTKFLCLDTQINDENQIKSNVSQEQSSVTTQIVDGVRVYKLEHNFNYGLQYVFSFVHNGKIYFLQRFNGKWSLDERVFQICSKEEYESCTKMIESKNMLTDEEISFEIINGIANSFGDDIDSTLTMEDFSKYKYSKNSLNVWYDGDKDKIMLESGAAGSQNYIISNGIIILDCHVAIFKNKSGNIEYAPVYFDSESQQCAFRSRGILKATPIENEFADKEIE